MEVKKRYFGYNDGCYIASRHIDVSTYVAVKLDAEMRQLEQDSIDGGFVLNRVIGFMFIGNKDAIIYEPLLNDQYIINCLKPFVAWKGQYAKVDGVWTCTIKMYKALNLFFFGQYTVDEKRLKDYSFILGKMDKGYFDYDLIVDFIAAANDCSIHRAKSLMTMFIQDGKIVKDIKNNKYAKAV